MIVIDTPWVPRIPRDSHVYRAPVVSQTYHDHDTPGLLDVAKVFYADHGPRISQDIRYFALYMPI